LWCRSLADQPRGAPREGRAYALRPYTTAPAGAQGWRSAAALDIQFENEERGTEAMLQELQTGVEELIERIDHILVRL
jgi:hypothetical protein